MVTIMNRLKAECLACLTKKYLSRYPEDSTEEQRLEYMRRFCTEIANASEELAAPVVVRNINNIHEEIFGNRIEYSAIKPYYNDLMMKQEKWIEQEIKEAEDPVLRAMQFALVGNYIDFGAMKQIDEEVLFAQLHQVTDKDIQGEIYDQLKGDLAKAKNLVYLTDNCGEIVLDKMLIKVLKTYYPELHVTVLVKGGVVLNDATIEDAKQIGLNEVADVMGNGNNIAGTWEPEFSNEARKVFDEADVILAKGQANYETLHHCGRNIYYLFLCKCDMFARDFGVEKLTGMLLCDKNL